jgi:subtilisin family serine protease
VPDAPKKTEETSIGVWNPGGTAVRRSSASEQRSPRQAGVAARGAFAAPVATLLGALLLGLAAPPAAHGAPPLAQTEQDADPVLAPDVAAVAAVASETADQLIVRGRDSGRIPPEVIARVAALSGGRAALGPEIGDGLRVIELGADAPIGQARDVAHALVREGLVVTAEPDIPIAPAALPDDPYLGKQWHLTSRYLGGDVYGIDVPTAWAETVGSADVVVAVLDSGILPHPDIAQRLVAGYDFVDGDADPTDPGCLDPARSSSWHGLHVAGTIGATTGNGIGIAGVDQRAGIQPVRVIGACEPGNVSDVLRGIRWAAGLDVPGVPKNDRPARVINLSLGGESSCTDATQSTVDAATAAGALVIAAAGNQDADVAGFTPANCRNVLTVAATTRTGERAPYSNYGAQVDIAAPGGDATGGHDGAVLSLSNTGEDAADPRGMSYGWAQGTSMAAPHVAGVASLVLAVAPELTPAELRVVLRETAQAFPRSPNGTDRTCSSDPAVGRHCGAGIVDAGAAVLANVAEPEQPTVEKEVLAPSWPSGATLRFDLLSKDVREVGLSWPKANGSEVVYDVYRDGSKVTTTSKRSATVTGLQVERRHELEVRARNTGGATARLHRSVRPSAGFTDVSSRSIFQTDILWLATADITRGCNPPANDRFCPANDVSREQMAAFLVRGLGLTERSGIRFRDVPSGSTFAADIDRLATAGITRGCNPPTNDRFCPGADVTREQMAAFLVRALDLRATSNVRFRDVPAGSRFAGDIDKLATAGITRGCNPPTNDRFCPSSAVTRAQMAAFVRRALTG